MPLKYLAPKLTVSLYHRFFILEITVVKIINNLNVCSPTAIYTPGPGLTQNSSTHHMYVLYLFSVIFFLIDRSCLVYVALYISLRIPLCLCIFTVFFHNYNSYPLSLLESSVFIFVSLRKF